jgi:glycosyltransferase involved in cell wall biosynthesis
VNIVWLSADPVVRGALGITDRIEGPRYFLRRGHEVLMITGGGAGAAPLGDIPTRIVRTRYLPFAAWLTLWPGVLRTLRRLDTVPDVIVSDFGLLPPAMRWARRVRRSGAAAPKVVLDVRSHPVEASRGRLAIQRLRFALTLRRYGRSVDSITTIGPELAAHVGGLARVDPSAIAVWTSGCAWCDAEPDSTADDPFPESVRGRFILFYHGMITAGRGLADAMRGVDIARRTAPDLAFVLLGDGGAREDLRSLVVELGLRDVVRFIDPVPQDRVPDFLRSATVGLAPWPPSWDMQANRPLKLTEYLCMGLPVVLTDITPHRIVPADAPFAFWAGDGGPQAFADAILEAYAARDDLPALGRTAAAWAAPRLGWAEQFAVLEGAIEATMQPPVDRIPADPRR